MRTLGQEIWRQGIMSRAERDRISIPGAAVIALRSLVRVDKLEEVPYLSDAVLQLDPGPIATGGLWEFAEITDRLRDIASTVIKDLRRDHSEEHIPRVRRAFTWHTGERL